MIIFGTKTNGDNNTPQQPRRRGGCLRGCLWAFLIYLVLSALMGALFGSMFSSSTEVALEDKTVYRLDLEGTLVEQGAPADPWAEVMKQIPSNGFISSDETVGLDQILANIRLAKEDDRQVRLRLRRYARR